MLIEKEEKLLAEAKLREEAKQREEAKMHKQKSTVAPTMAFGIIGFGDDFAEEGDTLLKEIDYS